MLMQVGGHGVRDGGVDRAVPIMETYARMFDTLLRRGGVLLFQWQRQGLSEIHAYGLYCCARILFKSHDG